MIIWNGFGILVPLIAIFGAVIGTIVGVAIGQPGAGIGIGLLLAALMNWGIWKLIYPKQPKILVDPATGQQVIIKPNHSLFFIPAKAWTWILMVLAVPMIFVGKASDQQNVADAKKPGYKEFTAANDMIDSSSKGICHGNTNAAKETASSFATGMKLMTEEFFSGGSKKNLMTGGDFLTYCHEGPESIVILCHVPSLRSYKSDEAKKALNDIAWASGRQIASKLDPEHKKTLCIGLRGIASFGSIQEGKLVDENSRLLDKSDKSVFYPAFAPVVAEVAPKAGATEGVQ